MCTHTCRYMYVYYKSSVYIYIYICSIGYAVTFCLVLSLIWQKLPYFEFQASTTMLGVCDWHSVNIYLSNLITNVAPESNWKKYYNVFVAF